MFTVTLLAAWAKGMVSGPTTSRAPSRAASGRRAITRHFQRRVRAASKYPMFPAFKRRSLSEEQSNIAPVDEFTQKL
jgi:hypothetical protein